MASDFSLDSSFDSLPLHRRGRTGQMLRYFVILAIVYLLIAYFLLPAGWGQYEKRHPALDDAPRITHTKKGIPGDPLNVAFVGSLEDLHLALLEAGWFPADPITLRSSLRIATGTLFHRKYVDAPVSNLVVWNRPQDLAFEQPAGKDPRRRHHVRFWRAAMLDKSGRPLWIGAATFDTKVGFSHTTGQITHHIDADIDKERDKLIDDVRRTGNLAMVYAIDGFQEKLIGKNGGGDPYHTDGRMVVGVLIARNRFGTPRLPPPFTPAVPATK
jgi:LssY C-terminus